MAVELDFVVPLVRESEQKQQAHDSEDRVVQAFGRGRNNGGQGRKQAEFPEEPVSPCRIFGELRGCFVIHKGSINVRSLGFCVGGYI